MADMIPQFEGWVQCMAFLGFAAAIQINIILFCIMLEKLRRM